MSIGELLSEFPGRFVITWRKFKPTSEYLDTSLLLLASLFEYRFELLFVVLFQLAVNFSVRSLGVDFFHLLKSSFIE